MDPYRAVDDFLIDRVFQPVCDALAPWATPCQIAEFLMVGSGLANVVMTAWPTAKWDGRRAGALLVALSVWAIAFIRLLDRGTKLGMAPANRSYLIPARIASILLCGNDVATALMSGLSVLGCIGDASYALQTAALFFIACRKLPPKPKRARVPRGAVTHGA